MVGFAIRADALVKHIRDQECQDISEFSRFFICLLASSHFSIAPFCVHQENARNTCWNPRLVLAPAGHCSLTCSVVSNQENTR